MENGWRGAPSQLPQRSGPVGSNPAVQRMLQEQQEGKEPNPQSFTARLESRRRPQFEWPPRRTLLSSAPQAVVRNIPPLAASTTGLKKVTWPPPAEDFDIADGEQEPVYAQEAPAINGFASPTPQYAQQVTRQGRPAQQQTTPQTPQTPPPHRRSASRDRSRRSPWTPPPTIISLRQSPPIHQEPSPVVVSQPATARMQASVQSPQAPQGALQNGHLSRTNSTSVSPVPGPASGIAPKPTRGVRARGDAKWPPQEYKTRADEENAQRVALAKGPVCRPRLPKKDYSSFFEQNRVGTMYPGYRAPPGTQHYTDETGVSEF